MSQQQRRPYVAPSELGLEPIEPGTSILVAGEAMSGVRDVVFDLALAGINQREGVILVSTDRSGDSVRTDAEKRVDYLPSDRFAIVDSTGSGQSDDDRIRTLSGPGDLTGIGIEFSSAYGGFVKSDIDRVRTGLHSVSTLLLYNDLRTVFRFLHTVTGRIESMEGLGLFGIDPSTQDERAVSTVAQLCDGRIDVRETEAGERQLRVRGLAEQPREWTTIG